MCNNPACSCQSPNYSLLGCDFEVPFGCVQFQRTNCNGVPFSYSCLPFKSGDSLFDLTNILEAWRCEYDSLKGKVFRDSLDKHAAFLTDKLKAGANINFIPSVVNGVDVIEINATSTINTVLDGKVKVSSTDNQSGFLIDANPAVAKLNSSGCLTFVKTNAGGYEHIEAVIDWACAMTQLAKQPGFCNAVYSCISALSSCGQINGITVIGITNTELFYTWNPGANNSSWNAALFMDSALTVPVPGTVLTGLTVPYVHYTGLNPTISYWLKIQPLCSNGGTVSSTSYGPIATSASTKGGCLPVTMNTPVVSQSSVTVTWTSSAVSFKVYLDNTLATSPAQPQTAKTITFNSLSKGYHTIKVGSECPDGPVYDIKSFLIV